MPTNSDSVSEQNARLARVVQLLDQVVKATVADPDLSHLAVRIGGILVSVFQLQSELWDIRPDLATASQLPMKEVDLSPVVDAMDRGDPAMMPHALGNMRMFAPPRIVSAAASLRTDEEKAALFRQWWSGVERPFVPIDYLDRTLEAPQRWRRLHAARALADLGVVNLLGPHGELDQDALKRWRANRP